jgi:hypothetical protein
MPQAINLLHNQRSTYCMISVDWPAHRLPERLVELAVVQGIYRLREHDLLSRHTGERLACCRRVWLEIESHYASVYMPVLGVAY